MAGNAYEQATLECDVVMKGGITSGVVYPGAVLELARHYRFRSIGGTSAGGIAAAIVAAAEYSPRRRGFAAVEALPAELGGTTGGTPFMLQVFRPDRSTRRLFAAAIGLMAPGRASKLLSLPRAFWRFPALGAALALLAGGLWAFAGVDAGFGVGGIAVAGLLATAGLAADVARATLALRENGYGMCRLGPEAVAGKGAPALTEWLHERIQETAGLAPGEPLTLGHLWAGPGASASPERLAELWGAPRERAVDLQMMTTNLTHGLPMRLPQEPGPDAPALLFEPRELSGYFPPEIIEHLERHAPELDAATAERVRGRDLRRLDLGPQLPVLVATRMSLSFPLLISAVPLWELDERDPDRPGLRRVWFSDGGLTSNFPVHFFDLPLPTRPTFGLDLTSFAPGEQPGEDPCAAVIGPRPVDAPAPDVSFEISDLFGFLVAIKDAMQNWRDNAQAELPGFRDRIAHVKLAKGEGGLNLRMPPEAITELNARGACAGRELAKAFTGPHWNDNRYVRYLTAMSLTERWLRELRYGYGSPVPAGTTRYRDRVIEGAQAPPYRLEPPEQLAFALGTTDAYEGLVSAWDEQAPLSMDGEHVPRPPSTLRAVPPV
jgi:predicted acylesterase/phospholipase RssA